MEPATWIALIGSGVLLFGAVLTFLAANGKTRVDYRTAMEARVDRKVEAYMDDLEERVTKAEDALRSAQGTIVDIQTEQAATSKRESILYRYIVLLREHIDRKLPPPPPTVPLEIQDLFDGFEDTWPHAGA